MARLNTQDIPPALVAKYKKALGKTRPIPYPGARYPTMTDSARRRYLLRLEPPHIPTVAQLVQRAYFYLSTMCFNIAPPNERYCYYRLSLPSGLSYYDYYQHLNIPRIMNGEICDDIRRPLATCFEAEGPPTYGYFANQFSHEGEVYLTFEADLFPGTYENHYGPLVQTLYAIGVCTWLYYEDPPIWSAPAVTSYYGTPPASWSGNIHISYFGCPIRRAYFFRSASDLSETMLWKFFALELENFHYYENWSQITP